MPPPRLQPPAQLIRPLGAVARARGLDVEIYDEISEKSCPVRRLVRSLHTGLMSSRYFFGTCSLTSDTRGGVDYLAGVAIVKATKRGLC